MIRQIARWQPINFDSSACRVSAVCVYDELEPRVCFASLCWPLNFSGPKKGNPNCKKEINIGIPTLLSTPTDQQLWAQSYYLPKIQKQWRPHLSQPSFSLPYSHSQISTSARRIPAKTAESVWTATGISNASVPPVGQVFHNFIEF